MVSSWLAFDHPVKEEEEEEWKSGVLGLHLNMVGVRPGIDLKAANLSAAEQAWLALPQPAHLFRLAGIYGPGRSALDTE